MLTIKSFLLINKKIKQYVKNFKKNKKTKI